MKVTEEEGNEEEDKEEEDKEEQAEGERHYSVLQRRHMQMQHLASFASKLDKSDWLIHLWGPPL